MGRTNGSIRLKIMEGRIIEGRGEKNGRGEKKNKIRQRNEEKKIKEEEEELMEE